MNRILIFLYGVIAYATFFITFCYAIGFVGNWIVPKSIDSGETIGVIPSLLINSGLLMLFVVQHTIMARPGFKKWWTNIIPRSMERSTFVLLASGILLLTFWQWKPLPTIVWDVQAFVPRTVLMALSLTGYMVVLYSSFLIDHFDLFGLRQVFLYLRNREYTQHKFMERSLYKVVRHPLMLGFLMAFWFTPTMTVGHLFFAIMTTGYILFGTAIEERDLVKQHGEDYLEYRRRTPALFPRLTRRPQPQPAPQLASE